MWITGIVLSAIGFNAEAAEQAADTIANLWHHTGRYPRCCRNSSYCLFADEGKVCAAADWAEAKEYGVEYRVEGVERVL